MDSAHHWMEHNNSELRKYSEFSTKILLPSNGS